MRFTDLTGLLAALIVALGLTTGGSPQIPSERVIFAVWPAQKGKRPDAPILDPIVIVDGKAFRNPMAYLQEKDTAKAQADADSFEKKYLVGGREYSMLFGGSDKGPIVIAESSSISCETLTATLVPPIPVANGQRALATTSTKGLGLHANWRELASGNQEGAFLKLASHVLSQHGAKLFVSSAIKLRNLRATKLGPDRPIALIGSVTARQKDAAHNLFLVAEQSGGQWNVALSSYHISKDLEDGVDDVEENFVDQLDLDADGMDEMITISSYYESWDYAIYKFQQGVWKKVYQGGGGGC